MGSRLIGIIFAFSVIILGAWGIFQYGPRPSEGNKKKSTSNSNYKTEENEKSRIAPNQKENSPQFSTVLNLLGESVGKGDEKSSITDFVAGIESRYKQRGYQSFEEVSKNREQSKKGIKNQKNNKFYVKTFKDNVCFIIASGTDANILSVEPDAKSETYWTLIDTKDGQVAWEIFRLRNSPAANNNLNEESDFSGQDPPFIPRPPETQRLYSALQEKNLTVIYKSRMSLEQTKQWYLNAMSSWQFIEPSNGKNDFAQGELLFFAQSEKLCSIWLSTDENTKEVSIVINLQT